MSRADKKRRHEAKRKNKRLAIKRRQSISPLKRLADAPGETEYWMSETLGAIGQLQAFAYKRAAGMTGIACFLIDRGVVGLKDAWARLHIDRQEFDDMLEGCSRRGIPMSRVTVEDVRRVVGGGIRWAHENGMRLPKDWTKPASLIGGVGDWASADLTGFVLEFAGHPEDLRQRLIGETFESYLRRPDVRFIFSDAAPYMDQGTGEYLQPNDLEYDDDDEEEEDLDSMADDLPIAKVNALAERFTAAAIGLASETVTWLSARNETPSTELVEAWRSILFVRLITKAALPDDSEAAAEFGAEVLETVSGSVEEDRQAEYELAVEQALHHLQTDLQIMKHAVEKYGLAAEPDGGPEEI